VLFSLLILPYKKRICKHFIRIFAIFLIESDAFNATKSRAKIAMKFRLRYVAQK
jgi:hypothetical protein